MAHPLPANITTSVDMFSYFNEVINIGGAGIFFAGIIMAIWFIIIIQMKFNNNDTGKSFAAASFMCMIISVFARVMNFVGTGFMSIFIIMTALGGLWVHIENRG